MSTQGHGINSTEVENLLGALSASIKAGHLSKESDEDVISWMYALSAGLAEGRKTALHIVQGIAVSNEMTARRIEKLHKDNTRMQFAVLFLAVIAGVGTIAQVVIGILSLCR